MRYFALCVAVIALGLGFAACDGSGPGGMDGDEVEEEWTLTLGITPDNTCVGAGEVPAISWSGAPEGTQSFAVVVYSSGGEMEEVLLLAANLPASAKQYPNPDAVMGTNNKGGTGYIPFCPDEEGEEVFLVEVYPLSEELNLSKGFTIDEFKDAVEGKTTDNPASEAVPGDELI